MSKQRRTVSLDESVDDYLSQTGVNASELVNELVKQYMNGNRSDEQIREFRKQQVRSEYEELANRARKKLEEFNELVNAEQQETVVDDEKRREKLRKLQMVPDDENHPLVQEIAQELNMEPQQALTEADEL